jgi:hypothetical protein
MASTIREFSHLDVQRAARERSPDTNASGNADVHMRHLATEEDHIEAGDRDELDSHKRAWRVLLYVSVAMLVLVFALMIARS